MKTNSKLLIVLLLMFLESCEFVKAPRNWLPEPKDSVKELYGAWITLRLKTEYEPIGGEFISFENDKIYVLTEIGTISINRADVISAIIDVHQRETRKVIVNSALGTCLSITTGWYFIFIAPIWIVSGIINTIIASQSGFYIEESPSAEWFKSIKKFSRFPNGLPENISLKDLKPKKIFVEE